MTEPIRSGSLAGLRVLDVSQGIAGPYAAALLGQQGATVVKVEPPAGDWGRRIGAGLNGQTGLSVAMNGGKLGVCLDASGPAGRAALSAIARNVDVVIENFRPGVAERLGIDHATLAADKPEITVLSISGFGTTGPEAKRPGTDSVIQATSGMMVMNSDSSGAPRLIPMFAVDTVTAIYAAFAVAAALFERSRTGRGRALSTSLLGCAAAFQAVPILDDMLAEHHGPGAAPVPSGVFATADGQIRITSVSDATFSALARCLDRSEWLEQADYATDTSRRANSERLSSEIGAILATQTTAAWLDLLAPQGVLCAPINDYATLRGDAQARALGLFGTFEQPGLGQVELPFVPFSDGPPRPAPRLGADTREGLAALGLPSDEIERLIADGVAVAM